MQKQEHAATGVYPGKFTPNAARPTDLDDRAVCSQHMVPSFAFQSNAGIPASQENSRNSRNSVDGKAGSETETVTISKSEYENLLQFRDDVERICEARDPDTLPVCKKRRRRKGQSDCTQTLGTRTPKKAKGWDSNSKLVEIWFETKASKVRSETPTPYVALDGLSDREIANRLAQGVNTVSKAIQKLRGAVGATLLTRKVNSTPADDKGERYDTVSTFFIFPFPKQPPVLPIVAVQQRAIDREAERRKRVACANCGAVGNWEPVTAWRCLDCGHVDATCTPTLGDIIESDTQTSTEPESSKGGGATPMFRATPRRQSNPRPLAGCYSPLPTPCERSCALTSAAIGALSSKCMRPARQTV